MKIKSKFVRKYGAEFGVIKHVNKANTAVQSALSDAGRLRTALTRSQQREGKLFRELEASEQALQYLQDKLVRESTAHTATFDRMQMLLQDTGKNLKYWRLLGITGWALAAVLAALSVVGLR